MIENDLASAVQRYETSVNHLTSNRGESGELFEQLICDVVKTVPRLLCSRTEYISAKIGNCRINNLQVDCHVRHEETNELLACVESKTYVDACFCKRAVSDFMSISKSKDCTKNTKFILFAGQRMLADNTLEYQREWLKEFTNKRLYLFVGNEIKQRNSTRPLYKEKYSLDITELKRFQSFLARAAGLPGLWICQALFSL